MHLSPDTWPAVSALLDEALALAPEKRDTWLHALDGERAAYKDTLRELLARANGVETSDFLATLPRFTQVAPAGTGGALTELAAGDAIGPYRLLSELGTGGMGAVWLAERSDGTLKRKVALKLPRLVWAKGLAERMARERDILATLEHPNIARLYDAGVDQHGRPYLALEYVEGQPIDAYCRARALGVKDKLQLLLQVCAAVAFAHSRLVVHRDLKPSNILVTADGQVRLLDFGIAKLLEGDSAKETKLTQLAGRALTLDYASPEQIKGEPIGTASDVYSLGVVSYELLTGAKPYRLKRGSSAELEEAIASADTPKASEAATSPEDKRALRGDLDAILNKALKKTASERYTTVDELSRDIVAHRQGRAIVAAPDSLWRQARRMGTRHWRELTASSLAVCVLLVAVGVGATAVVIAALAVGLGAAVLQARQAQRERDLALELSDRNEAATTFINTLLTHAARSGSPLNAEQLIERSERLLEEELKESPDNRANVLTLIASSAYTLGHGSRALELLDRAIDALRDSRDKSLRAKVLMQRAVVVGWMGRSTEARQVLEGLLAHGELRPEEACEAHHYMCLMAYQEGAEPSLRLRHAGEALRLHGLMRRPNRQMKASILAELADAHLSNGDVDLADARFAEAIDLMKALGKERSPHGLVVLGNWGVMLDSVGDLRASHALFERCLQVAREQAPDAEPHVTHVINHARCLQQMGLLAAAEDGLRRGLEQAERHGAALAVQYVRINLASAALDRGDVQTAKALLDAHDADRRADIAPASKFARMRHVTGGRLALQRGEFDLAQRAFSAALADLPRTPVSIMALIGRSELHLARGDRAAARGDAEAAVNLARALQGQRRPSYRTGLALLACALAEDPGSSVSAPALARQAVLELEQTVQSKHAALQRARELAGLNR